MSEATEIAVPEASERSKIVHVTPRVPDMTPGPERVSYQANPELRLPRLKANPAEPLDRATRALVALTDAQGLTQVERSNLFDDWKDALARAAETGLVRSTHQRQIVGLLLASTHQRDAVDFSHAQLQAFRTTTNAARMNPVEIDLNRAITTLIDHGLLRPMALSPEVLSERDSAELDAIAASFGVGEASDARR